MANATESIEEEITHEKQMEAYGEAVRSGLYAKRSGLVGKYDNVRCYWEDEISREALRPHLQKLIERTRKSMRRLRIMDLGCGSADGFELLTGVRLRDPDLRLTEVDLLTPDVLGLYKGVDLSEDLLAQARGIYGGNPKMIFEQADFTKGLPLHENEKPYDLYFTSYGTFSHHNDDETAINLIVDIAKHTKDYSLLVCDWLGRYSYEWNSLWTNDLNKNRNMDYIVSYIYEEDEREARRDELQHLLLRLLSRDEADDIIRRAAERAGVEIRPLGFYDRSVFTGRHMDTSEYNPHAQSIRQAVNSLHETNIRTDFSQLLVDYAPQKGFDHLNDYYEHLLNCWNVLVQYADLLMANYNEKERRYETQPPGIPGSYPPVLREMMDRMRRVVEDVGWLGHGLPRENIIEPQLGYALRYLITRLQRGIGCAHGMVGIFEIDKTG